MSKGTSMPILQLIVRLAYGMFERCQAALCTSQTQRKLLVVAAAVLVHCHRSRAVGVCERQEEYQSACKRTERAESEALSAEVALRDERVQNRAAAAKLQDELDKCAHFWQPAVLPNPDGMHRPKPALQQVP